MSAWYKEFASEASRGHAFRIYGTVKEAEKWLSRGAD
jgi:hypothetical protein